MKVTPTLPRKRPVLYWSSKAVRFDDGRGKLTDLTGRVSFYSAETWCARNGFDFVNRETQRGALRLIGDIVPGVLQAVSESSQGHRGRIEPLAAGLRAPSAQRPASEGFLPDGRAI